MLSMESGRSTLAFANEIEAAHNTRVLASETVPEETKLQLAEMICAEEIQTLHDEEAQNQTNIADILSGDSGTRLGYLRSINERRQAASVEAALEKTRGASRPWRTFVRRQGLI